MIVLEAKAEDKNPLFGKEQARKYILKQQLNPKNELLDKEFDKFESRYLPRKNIWNIPKLFLRLILQMPTLEPS
ncbi:MAG: hypothetical protein N2662_01035 [Bacteroidales bacterium]|nr:hypothetical protein [Bacteroidales bacterium]